MSARHTRSKGKEVVTPSPPAPPSRTAKRSKARSRAAPSSASSFTLEDEEDESLLVSLLPMECLVEVLRYLEVHELLDVAWTCKRFHLAAQDHALWDRTHFSVSDWQSVLQRHFAEDPAKKPNKDHTGTWSRCICRLNQASLMCREVELDYVDRGEGVCYRLLRSVSCLQQLHHPHIVPLVFINLETERNTLRLLYEDAGNPLEEELKANRPLSLADARSVLRQVLEALAHCHGQGITHRNLKPKYMLLRRPDGRESGWHVKLSDFNSVRWLGMQRTSASEEATIYGSAQVAGACSPTVVTQPYRAPEILLGCTSYDTSIDIWACGCVFAEMCSAHILFAGDSDIGQLIKIFNLLGTPGPDKAVEWPGVEGLPYYSSMFPSMKPKDLRKNPATELLCTSPAAEDLLRRMLSYDPAKRITAADALRHPFLQPDSPPRELANPPMLVAARSGDGGAKSWILRSALEFCKCDRTVHLAVGILDHVIRLHPPPLDVAAISDGSGSWIELLGIAALLLACKFQEVEIHTVEEFVYYADARYDAGDALEAEVRICSALRLDFAIPTALDFLYCLLHRLQWPTAFAVHRGLDCEAVMLAQLLCELSLLSHELSVCPRSSLVASCALCLSLACLRCGCWRDGSPGPASMPELYWTPSMVQATGYTRDDLRAPMGHLQAIHEQAAVHIHNINVFAPDGQWDKWAVLKYKFAQPRFLNILRVPPFTPHQGGSVFFASSANAAGRSHVAGSPLAQPAYHLAPPAAAADALPFDGGGGDAEPAAAPEQVQ